MATYKGFELFNDLENANDRATNRGRILSNIATDHQRNGKFSVKGVALSTGYLRAIAPSERQAAVAEFVLAMEREGFQIRADEATKERAIEQAIR